MKGNRPCSSMFEAKFVQQCESNVKTISWLDHPKRTLNVFNFVGYPLTRQTCRYTWSSVRYPKGREETAPSLSNTLEIEGSEEKKHTTLPLLLTSPDGLPGGGFLKWWYPTTIAFPTKNDHFGAFWGYHHLRKPQVNIQECWPISTDPKSYLTGKLGTKTL